MKLLIASTNRGKIREIWAALAYLPLQLILPADLNLALDVAETGNTYAENAVLKARAYCIKSGLVSLADDSGLEVAALGGAPGLHSARYSPQPGAQDADRRAYLLKNLGSIPFTAGMPGWKANFFCAAAIATPQGGLYLTEGRCHGVIIPEERGPYGFGYDRLFFLPEYGQTMAEIPEQLKNQISHRARALQAAQPILERLIADEGDQGYSSVS